MKVVRDAPEPPVVTAVKYIEHIMRYGDGWHFRRRTFPMGALDGINHRIYDSLVRPIIVAMTWNVMILSVAIYFWKFRHITVKVKKIRFIKGTESSAGLV